MIWTRINTSENNSSGGHTHSLIPACDFGHHWLRWPGVLLSLNTTKANTLKVRNSLLSQPNRRPKVPAAFSFSATNFRSSQKFAD
jgi:hypothetical protein